MDHPETETEMPPVHDHQRPFKMFALALILVSLVMGLVLLLKWVVEACRPEDEYPWAVTYRGLLERDEEAQNQL